MKPMMIALLAAAALPAVASAQMSQPMSSGQSMASDPSTMASMSPSDYVMQAGASDMFEITSSRTVLSSTKDPKVRMFAQQMIKDHTTSTKEVMAAARKDKVAMMPPKLNSMQADMVAQLKAAKGPARDSLYMQQQAQSHQMALQLQQSYAANGTAPDLKMTAGMIVPVVQSHIAMLQNGGSMASGM